MQVSEFILLEQSEDNFHFYSGWFLNITSFRPPPPAPCHTTVPHRRQACPNILIQQVTSLPPGPHIPWDRDLAPPHRSPVLISPAASSIPCRHPPRPPPQLPPPCRLPMPHPAGTYPSCSRQTPPLAPAHTRQPHPAPPRPQQEAGKDRAAVDKAGGRGLRGGTH